MKISSLVLASQSRWRSQLLATTGVEFTVTSSSFDEHAIKNSSLQKLSLARAKGKAIQVAQSLQDALIIGADQVVECDGQVYSKVETAEEAESHLRKLSGKEHQLNTAFCLVYRGSDTPPVAVHEQVVVATMTMRDLSEAEIQAYVETNEWQGCSGCYQFENRGVNLFSEVNSRTDIIAGLPLLELTNALRKTGVETLLNPKGPWQLNRTQLSE